MKKAFTLIELLVVIAIIAILAAILFPVFAQAKNAAKKTADLSNVKEIVIAEELWKTDHDGYMVQASYNYMSNFQPTGNPYPFGGWQYALMPYMKNKDIFTSPLDPGLKKQGLDTTPDYEFYTCDVFDPATGYCAIDPKTGDYYWKDAGPVGAKATDDDFGSSYRLNSSNQPGYSQADPSIHFRSSANESSIDQLSSMILIVPSGFGTAPNQGEGNTPYEEVTTANIPTYQDDITCPNNVDNVDYDRNSRVAKHPTTQAQRNQGKANYGFGDGHAKSLAWMQTWQRLGSDTKDSAGNAVMPTPWRQSFTGAPDACKYVAP